MLAIDDDRLELAEALLSEIGAAPNRPAGLRIRDPADPLLDPIAERYVGLIDSDPVHGAATPATVAAACRERMHRAVAQLLRAGVLDRAASTEAQASLAPHRRAFAQGLAVTDGDARLTERGPAIMAGARAYMARGAA